MNFMMMIKSFLSGERRCCNMIIFSKLGKMGRLGNQLFQYAALKSIAAELGCDAKIPNLDNLEWHGQKCPLKYFNLDAKYYSIEDVRKLRNRFIEKNHSTFSSKVYDLPDNTEIEGFFQSYKYFNNIEDEIRKEFTLKDDIQKLAKNYLHQLRKKIGNKELVSVHMRRGDNTDGTNKEYANFYGDGDVLTKESEFGKYLYSAIDVFKDKDVAYLVFSGGSRKGKNHNKTDIEWCKDNFFGDNIYYCEGNEDIVDFEIMRRCDHNITCHMTSFGWWAAFLNSNPDKIVVAPKNYTIPDDGRVQQGFYPPDWRTI